MRRVRLAAALVALLSCLGLGRALADPPEPTAADQRHTASAPGQPAADGKHQPAAGVQEPAADGKHQPAAEHPPAGAADAKLRPLSFDDLLTTYYAPLTDHHRGRLYEAATALLNAVRELPKAIDLGVALPAAEAQPGPEDAAGTGEDTAAPLGFSQAAERGKWLAVLDHPVVAEEDVAYALFLAGSFKDAAAAYRKLREGHADDRHYLIMLLLSESNAGNAAEARNLLAELAKKGDEPAKWAAWMTEMMKLRAEQSKAKESK